MQYSVYLEEILVIVEFGVYLVQILVIVQL